MPFQVLTYVLWLTATLLQAVLALVMWRRRLVREFPLFFLYTLMHVARAAINLPVYRMYGYTSREYFLVYWANEAVDTLLQLAVTYEIYVHVFRRYESVSHLGKVLFRWSLVALLLLSIASIAASPAAESSALRTAVLMLHQSTIVITGGLLLLLFIFTASFGLSWRPYVFGMAAGLCLCTTVELAVVVFLNRWGAMGSLASTLIHATAYNCSVLLWVGYFVRRERVPVVEAPVPSGQLEKWNEALAELLNR